VSHRLLVRAGFIRQLMAGHYMLLPLAVRVRAKIIEVIRQEMDRIGGQECLLPAMHPAEVWQAVGPLGGHGRELFRVRDRKGADLALGMTHEEIFTTLALELRSYRDLPQVWYQFQTKFRDEPRPRSGLIRVREFTMKDSYSFDLDPAGLDRAFDLHHQAYVRSFERLGVPAVPVRASSGQMGGSASVEFVCPSEAGEDLVVRCRACGYAANVEKATSALPAAQDTPGPPAPERFATPGVRTIEDLARDHQAPADRQVKTLVYVLDGRPTLVLLRGDHSLVEQKLFDATGAAAVRPAHPDEVREALGALPGQPGRRRRGRPAGGGRPGPGGPARPVHRGPTSTTSTSGGWTWTGTSGSALGGPAGDRGRRALPGVRAGPGGAAGHRGRPHLQAGLRLQRGPRPVGARPRRPGGDAGHGQLRDRDRAGHGRHRGVPPRRRRDRLAGRGGPLHGCPGRPRPRRCPASRRTAGAVQSAAPRRPAPTCSSTTASCAPGCSSADAPELVGFPFRGHRSAPATWPQAASSWSGATPAERQAWLVRGRGRPGCWTLARSGAGRS
jgi:hypothetical protein